MKPKEKEAFIKAYSTNVAMVDDADVRAFLDRVDSGEDVDYSHDYTSIMDALGMWHDAISYQLEQLK
jgi:hypothetical protein